MTKTRWVAWLACLWPFVAFADGVSFTPPTGDYSVIFLSNIFGVVDGVLSGTGSQIVGTMFSVLNAAVLAIGGIVIMYTLVVATMNTAHEGKFLGEKWSSIWVPVRVAVGLALLLPKASGYCMMQIFFMWVIVQGVGAADKVWDAALQYLNRGGVIIAEQLQTSSTSSSSTANITQGAMTILAGQVCMLGLQNVLQAAQKSYQSTASSSGPCYGTAPNSSVTAICTATVPDFIASVNAVAAQQLQMPSGYESSLCQSSSSSSSSSGSLPAYFIVQMPNFPSTSEYVSLNGICGSIAWNPISSSDMQSIQSNVSSTTCADLQATAFSRAIAIQQMYVDLQPIATTMVNNDPQLASLTSTSSTTSTATTTFSSIATSQFGVPLQSNNQLCTTPLPNSNCVAWGPDQTTDTPVPVLFSGTELNQAVLDYDGVMMPTLNLISEANSNSNANSAKGFISNAQQQGWLMAGAYFFNLITLNGNAASSSQQIDSTSGLEQSVTPCASFQSSSFGSGSACNPTQACGSAATPDTASTTYPSLCYMLNMNATNVNYINALISGLGLSMTTLSITSSTFSNTNQSPIQGIGSSTVYGFGINESMVVLPGQPGTTGPNFQFNFKPSVDFSFFSVPNIHFPLGLFGLGRLLGDIFYTLILKQLLEFVVSLIMQFAGVIITLLLYVPMYASAQIIIQAMGILTENGVNPIICLGNMGTSLINFVLEFIPAGIGVAFIGVFYPMIFSVLIAVAPFTVSMVMAFFTIGMLTAYYIPFVPYIAFLTGVIAWFIAAIEAMVAAPLVALGVVYPEGHEVLGKAEGGFMILLNVFLRPAMMIIGFILGISLSYVSIWVLNAGFQNAQNFFYGNQGIQYVNFAAMLTVFYSTMIYTMLYLTLVQKAFSLIYILPDGILRWIGGSAEHIGGEAAQWGQETKDQVSQMNKKLQSGVTDTQAASSYGGEMRRQDRQEAFAADSEARAAKRKEKQDEEKNKLTGASAKKDDNAAKGPEPEKDNEKDDKKDDDSDSDSSTGPSIERGAVGGVPSDSSGTNDSSEKDSGSSNLKAAKENDTKNAIAGEAIRKQSMQEQASKIKPQEAKKDKEASQSKDSSTTTTTSSSTSKTDAAESHQAAGDDTGTSTSSEAVIETTSSGETSTEDSSADKNESDVDSGDNTKSGTEDASATESRTADGDKTAENKTEGAVTNTVQTSNDSTQNQNETTTPSKQNKKTGGGSQTAAPKTQTPPEPVDHHWRLQAAAFVLSGGATGVLSALYILGALSYKAYQSATKKEPEPIESTKDEANDQPGQAGASDDATQGSSSTAASTSSTQTKATNTGPSSRDVLSSSSGRAAPKKTSSSTTSSSQRNKIARKPRKEVQAASVSRKAQSKEERESKRSDHVSSGLDVIGNLLQDLSNMN